VLLSWTNLKATLYDICLDVIATALCRVTCEWMRDNALSGC